MAREIFLGIRVNISKRAGFAIFYEEEKVIQEGHEIFSLGQIPRFKMSNLRNFSAKTYVREGNIIIWEEMTFEIFSEIFKSLHPFTCCYHFVSFPDFYIVLHANERI